MARAWQLGTALIALALLTPSVSAASVNLGTANTTSLSSGLVGYWPLDGATTNWTTGITRDLSGSGYTGNLVSLSTSSSPATGKVGQALKFNGSSSYVNIAGITSDMLTTNFTVSVWVKKLSPFSGSAEWTVMGTRNSNTSGWQIGISNAGIPIWRTFSGTQNNITFSGTSVTAGVWTHLVFVHGDGSAALYKNGVLVTSSAITNPATGGTVPLKIGHIGIGSGGSYWEGLEDDVKIYNRALSAQEVALLYASGNAKVGAGNGSALNDGLKLYWPLDGSTITWTSAFAGTARDMSGNGVTGTINMGRATSTRVGKIGQALRFDGSNAGSYALTGTVTGTISDFAFSFWQYVDTPQSNIISIGFVGGESFYTLAGDSTYRWVNSSFDCSPTTFGSGLLQADYRNRWRHIVFMRSGTTLSVYRDGVFSASCTGGSATKSNPAIGVGNFFPGRDLIGRMDEIRFYNRALSLQEIQGLYRLGSANIGHTPTVSSGQNVLTFGLVGHWTFDGPTMGWKNGTTTDQSGNGNTGTLVNMSTTTSPTIGKIGQALQFNGSSSYVSIPASATLNASSDVTTTAWVYLTSKIAGALGNNIFSKRGGSTNYQFWIRGDGSSPVANQPVLASWNGSTNVYGTTALSLNKWYFVAMVHSASSVTFYINGVADGTQSQTIGGTLSSQAYIGWDTATVYFAGKMDDVRVYNRSLSAQEIQQLYLLGK